MTAVQATMEPSPASVRLEHGKADSHVCREQQREASRMKNILLSGLVVMALTLGACAATTPGETVEPPETELKATIAVDDTPPHSVVC